MRCYLLLVCLIPGGDGSWRLALLGQIPPLASLTPPLAKGDGRIAPLFKFELRFAYQT